MNRNNDYFGAVLLFAVLVVVALTAVALNAQPGRSGASASATATPSALREFDQRVQECMTLEYTRDQCIEIVSRSGWWGTK